jgi:hypothetical protein
VNYPSCWYGDVLLVPSANRESEGVAVKVFIVLWLPLARLHDAMSFKTLTGMETSDHICLLLFNHKGLELVFVV